MPSFQERENVTIIVQSILTTTPYSKTSCIEHIRIIWPFLPLLLLPYSDAKWQLKIVKGRGRRRKKKRGGKGEAHHMTVINHRSSLESVYHWLLPPPSLINAHESS